MQQKGESFKSYYSSNWLSSAKLLSLLIFVCCGSFLVSCTRSRPKPLFELPNQPITSESAVNINSAAAQQLEKLPRIGRQLAREIIEHREKYGGFRRTEELILVRGMSDKKYREIRYLVKVE